MSKNNILKRALLDAFGVIAYISLFAWIISHLEKWFGNRPDNWLDPIFFLSMFIVSACVTGSLVILKPILLYLEGQKKEAVHLFLYTIGFLALMSISIGLLLIIFI